MSAPYDVVTIGSGTTAFAAALRAAERGARVLMVEQGRLGGTCVNWGCIPSKTLIHKAHVCQEARRGAAFGLNLTTAFPDCSLLMESKRAAVEAVRAEHYQAVLAGHPQIEVRRGHGRFLSPRELQVGADVLVSDRFLIATGGVPRIPRIPGLAEVEYLTSYSALHLPCFPASLLILGGGVVALELGQMFRRFGTEVTVLEHGRRLLKEFDPRLTALLAEVLEEEGVRVVFGAEALRVSLEGGESCLVAAVDGEERRFRAERLLLAVGTEPATADLGLEAAGVAVDARGFVAVDDQLRTSVPGIWAAGDVTGPPLIAPAGAREGELAAENMLDPQARRRIDHRHTPMAVFVDPEIACVGSTLSQAREEGLEAVEVFCDLEGVAKAQVLGGRHGGILLTAQRGTGRVLGVQLLAPQGAEVIQTATLAVRFGLTVHDLATGVPVYPTIGEGLRLAALECISRL